MRYLFTAESQYIFTVTIEGRPRLVKFGDKNNFGVCAFATEDANIAEKIRSLTVFKRGAIVEATPQAALQPPKGESVPEAEATGAGAENAKAPAGEGNVKTFADFTRAKEWICKEFGLQKNKVRNPKALEEIAAERGLTIRYETE